MTDNPPITPDSAGHEPPTKTTPTEHPQVQAAQPAAQPAERPAMSVIVCSHNGAHRIGATLQALTEQDFPHPYEIVVIDDGSRDTTADVSRSHGVRVISYQPNQGLSAARNRGIAETSGDIVCFTDDDCIPAPDWLSRLHAAWQTAPGEVTGIGGTTCARDVDSLVRRYVDINNPLQPLDLTTSDGGGIGRRLLAYLRQDDPAYHPRYVGSLVGANMSFRRDALTTIGGFDAVITFGGDEEDLCNRLRQRYGNHTLWVEPGIVIRHDFDKGLRDTLRRARAYGRGNGRAYARKGGIPSIRPLPVLAAMLAGTALLFRGPRWATITLLGTPYLIYRKLIRRPHRNGKPGETLTYPLIAALQEIWNGRGFWEGWLKHRRRNR